MCFVGAEKNRDPRPVTEKKPCTNLPLATRYLVEHVGKEARELQPLTFLPKKRMCSEEDLHQGNDQLEISVLIVKLCCVVFEGIDHWRPNRQFALGLDSTMWTEYMIACFLNTIVGTGWRLDLLGDITIDKAVARQTFGPPLLRLVRRTSSLQRRGVNTSPSNVNHNENEINGRLRLFHVHTFPDIGSPLLEEMLIR